MNAPGEMDHTAELACCWAEGVRAWLEGECETGARLQRTRPPFGLGRCEELFREQREIGEQERRLAAARAELSRRWAGQVTAWRGAIGRLERGPGAATRYVADWTALKPGVSR